jgi:hypothetical protein
MKSTRLCPACGKAVVPLRHVFGQRYCSSEACHRARRDWQNTDSVFAGQCRLIEMGFRSAQPISS